MENLTLYAIETFFEAFPVAPVDLLLDVVFKPTLADAVHPNMDPELRDALVGWIKETPLLEGGSGRGMVVWLGYVRRCVDIHLAERRLR